MSYFPYYESIPNVQVRPMLEFESLKGGTDCLKLRPPNIVTLPPLRGATEEYRFEYDRVYDMVATTGDDALYTELVAPLVARVLQGFNATVSTQCTRVIDI